MSTIQGEVPGLPFVKAKSPKGPMTVARQRRTFFLYAVAFALGLIPLLIGASPAWQAAGLGLWMPGAGFVAVGGWTALLFPVTLVLFVVSLVAWFWAGMVVAPVTVWLGSALVAGVLASEAVWPGAHPIVLVCMAAVAISSWRRTERRRSRDEAKAARRRTYVPASILEVERRAAHVPDATTRELSADELPSVRYLLDRALQPVTEFNGFDIIDQFQPAALRYQLNHLGFALGIVQGAYVPNFHGYMHQAQRNVIDKYLLRRVWDYWVLESCWGHLNFTNWDPARRDNIMLTGWFGMHVGQYMLNSGDRRYAKKGSLTFRLNARTAYEHDFHTIIHSVAHNYTLDEGEFCIYPCEPNWMYPICNHYGMTSLAVHDRLFGTKYVQRFLPSWLHKLDTEFTDASGSIIGLRSQLTGFEVPFPVGESGYANFAHCFAPERARRLWATARKEMEPLMTTDEQGNKRLRMPGRGLDAGNYSTGHVAAYGGIMMAAREFGDDEISEAAYRGLDQDCGLSMEGGVRRYLRGSNLANISAAMGRLMRTGDFRRSFVEGPAECTVNGPVLDGVIYPDVLVARAFSHGEDLELTLYPGTAAREQTIRIERLQPGRNYEVNGAAATRQLVADADGRASLGITLQGRTSVVLKPA